MGLTKALLYSYNNTECESGSKSEWPDKTEQLLVMSDNWVAQPRQKVRQLRQLFNTDKSWAVVTDNGLAKTKIRATTLSISLEAMVRMHHIKCPTVITTI